MLRNLKKIWRKITQRNAAQDVSHLPDHVHALSARDSETPSVPSELQRIQGEIDHVKSRDAELLAALNARIADIDAASAADRRELAALRQSLEDATERQEKAETRIRQLREQQEAERREHQAHIQESMVRERRQNRRLGWALLLACCALLLGTFVGVTSIRDSRQYAGLLAELSLDIKDIKTFMERQAASQRLLPDAAAPPTTSAIPDGGRENTEDIGTNRRDAVRQQTDIATILDHYHPHNKYRNRKEMLGFFKENAGELGVISVTEGLQYRVVDQGAGKSPATEDTVVLDYSAFLVDGTQLFSSYDKPLPARFRVSQLVPGLQEIVPRMQVGARWEVYVSPDHAYRGGVRKRKKYGYEPLVYVVELRSVIAAGDSTL